MRATANDPSMGYQAQTDPFTTTILELIESGALARIPGNDLKSRIVGKVQSYSVEAQYDQQLPDIFLNLCDLMVSSGLGRMSAAAFKLYLVVMAYGDTPQHDRLQSRQYLKKVIGVEDDSLIESGLEYLWREGYIESPHSPELRAKKRHQDRAGDGTEKLFFI